MLEDPKVETKVVHSESKSAWNLVMTGLGGKYKICRVPYVTVDNDEFTERNRKEALKHAQFISYCFNNSASICENYKSMF